MHYSKHQFPEGLCLYETPQTIIQEICTEPFATSDGVTLGEMDEVSEAW